MDSEFETKLFEKTDRSARSIIKKTFIESCLNSTVHAVPNILRSESIILKVIWFILFLGATGGGIYYLYSSLATYFQYNVSVAVKWYDNNLENFPAITICNINPFDSSNSGTKSFLDAKLTANGLTTNIVATDANPAIYQVRQALKVLKASTISYFNSNSSYVYDLGYTIDSMLISCYYNGVKCNSSDFSKSYSFDYGNCYTFNKYTTSSSLKMTSKTGPSSGLSLELYVGYPGKQDYYIEQRGIYLAVHNNSQIALTKYDGIKVPVGYVGDVSIKRTFIYRKEAPYSTCKKNTDTSSSTDSDYAKATISLTRYSKKLCYEICLQYKYIIPTCNCSDPSVLITDSKLTICSSLTDLSCVDSTRNKFDSTDLSSTCSPYCPAECDKIFYDTTLSLADYPTTYYYNIVSKQSGVLTKFNSNGNITYDTYKQSALLLNVYYKELGYTSVVESAAYTGETIFATLGGQLGMLMGLSLLSVCEIFIFAINVIIQIIKGKTKKTIQPTT